VKRKIGFVCIGQAGGNIGQILESQGYNCLFINTSREDLDTLNTKYRYHIEGGEGCNHNREKAISLIKKDYRRVLEEVQDKLYHQQLIYLVFSTGGGTGSGFAPILLEALSSTTNKSYGCITILPAFDEPLKAHMNAFKCYQELSTIEKLATVFTLDNEKLNKFTINTHFVSLFNTALDITNHLDTRGNIDKAELWEMLNTRGNAIITTCNSSSSTNLTSSIIKSWEQNVFADIERDKSIVYMGLSLTADINLDDLKKYIGNPLDVFKNYNRDQTVTILSGLSFPKARINKIIDTLNNNKDTIKKNILNSKINKIDTSIDWLDDIEKPASKDTGIHINLEEIFSKY